MSYEYLINNPIKCDGYRYFAKTDDASDVTIHYASDELDRNKIYSSYLANKIAKHLGFLVPKFELVYIERGNIAQSIMGYKRDDTIKWPIVVYHCNLGDAQAIGPFPGSLKSLADRLYILDHLIMADDHADRLYTMRDERGYDKVMLMNHHAFNGLDHKSDPLLMQNFRLSHKPTYFDYMSPTFNPYIFSDRITGLRKATREILADLTRWCFSCNDDVVGILDSYFMLRTKDFETFVRKAYDEDRERFKI